MRLVAGRYAVLEELGRGGMGVVWRAEDRVIGRQVALKELPAPQAGAGHEASVHHERVLREARTAGRLNDPAVVAVYDVLSEEGSTFIVMELVRAPSVAELIARNGALPAERVVSICGQVLGALQAAHDAGIVHRDVKPSNIMVLPDGQVKLADFGIAKAMDDPGETTQGGVLGSPGYMAPELFSGAGPSAASDLWALGSTLFHAVQGWAPFQRETTAATVHAILYDTPSLESCPSPLHRVISGLLVREVEQRFTAGTVRALLDSGDARESENPHPVAGDAPTGVVDAATSVVRDTPPRPSWHELPGEFDDQEPPNRSRRRSVLVAVPVVLAVVLGLGVVLLLRPGTTTGRASAVAEREPSVPAGPSTTAVTSSTTATSTTATSSSSTTQATSARAEETPVPTRQQRSGPKTVAAPEPSVTRSATGEPDPRTSAAKPDLQLVRIVRYHHPDGAHFTATSSVPPPPGFEREWTLGYLVANHIPGTKKLYACRVPGRMDYFTSADQSGNCEGQKTLGLLGYIFASPPEGVRTRPLYRCNAGADHFDSLRRNCEGETFELLHGYVVVK